MAKAKFFLVVLAGLSAAEAYANSCPPIQNGPSYTLNAVKPNAAANGYHLDVNINQGQTVQVLVDTGSNLLILPYFYMGGFPQPANSTPVQLTGPTVVSGELPYAYGSSGNSYLGYLVQANVAINPNAPGSPTAQNVIVYAVTQTCDGAKCQAVMPKGNGAAIGMMGVGFQAMKSTMVMTNGKVPTNTNTLAQIPGLQTVGYIFKPNQIVVGLTPQNTQGVTWYPMDTDTSNGAGVPTGCFTIAMPNAPVAGPYCGSMLLDTGLGDMYAWQNSTPSICPPPNNGSKTQGFAGVPFPTGTKVTLTSPDAKGAAMNYTFSANPKQLPQPVPPVPGTPNITYCAATNVAPHANISRLPLELYTYYRNQSCNTFGFTRN